MKRPVPVAWHEYLPAGTALAVVLYRLVRGEYAPAGLYPAGLIAVLYPASLVLERRFPQQGWTRFFRRFLPLLLLFPLHGILSDLLTPPLPGGHLPTTRAFPFNFSAAAVILYLCGALAYTFMKEFKGFRRLSLGVQAVFYLNFLLLPFVPADLLRYGSALPVALMTFVVLYDFIYRQRSLIASFIILALCKVVVQMDIDFSPAVEAATILIPAAVLACLRLSGFPRR